MQAAASVQVPFHNHTTQFGLRVFSRLRPDDNYLMGMRWIKISQDKIGLERVSKINIK